MAEDTADILTLTTEIVSSYVGASSTIRAEDIPALIKSVRAALMEEANPAPAEEPTPKATKGQITKSIQPDGLVSFLDGKKYKTLRRHITRHGHTPESYRSAYGLPSDYPLVAADYSAARSQMARDLGLGARGRGGKGAAPAKAPAKRGPKPKAPVGES